MSPERVSVGEEGESYSMYMDRKQKRRGYMCAQIRVWSCLVTDNFGLFTEINVCTFLRDWLSYGLKPFYFVSPVYGFIHFPAAFCRAHCALDLAGDHAP